MFDVHRRISNVNNYSFCQFVTAKEEEFSKYISSEHDKITFKFSNPELYKLPWLCLLHRPFIIVLCTNGYAKKRPLIDSKQPTFTSTANKRKTSNNHTGNINNPA